MMDYLGSVIQSKEQIYKDIGSRFPEHRQGYIESTLDHLYETNFINEEVSVSGWHVFVGPEVVRTIDEMIQRDLEKSKLRLLIAKCLLQRDDISLDVIETITVSVDTF